MKEGEVLHRFNGKGALNLMRVRYTPDNDLKIKDRLKK